MLPIQSNLLRKEGERGRVGSNRPGDANVPKMVIIHRTGNPGSTALQNRNFFDTEAMPTAYASAHYCLDAKNIILCVPENERAHHCIGANRISIGIEIFEPYTEAAYQNALDLIANICLRYRWQPDVQHIQTHSKYDPVNRPYDPFSWNAFAKGLATPGRDLFDPFKFYRDIKARFTEMGGILL